MMITWEWLGGFIDGDGGFTVSVYCRKDKSRLEIRPCLEIANTDRELIKDIGKFLGVPTYPERYEGGNRSYQERIAIMGKKLLEILLKVYPYIKSKRKRKCAEIIWIMQYIKSLRTGKRSPLTTIEILAILTQKVRDLNTKKRARYKWGAKEIMEYYKKRVMPPNPKQVIYAHKKATPELIAKVKELRKKGLSYAKIAEEMGISKRTGILWDKCFSNTPRVLRPDLPGDQGGEVRAGYGLDKDEP